MKAAFVPFSQRNPYQRLLAANLSKRGVNVVGQPTKAHILADMELKNLPEILHIHWLAPFFKSERWPNSRARAAARAACLVAELRVLRALGTRIIWTAHNLSAHEPQFPRVNAWVHRRVAGIADAVIAHSETARREVIRVLGAKADSTFVVPHGHFMDWYPNTVSRSEARRTLGLSDANLVFLYFGLIRPYKQVPALIRTFRQADLAAATNLVVAGNPLTASLAQEVEAAAGADDRCIFSRGYIPDELVQVYFNAADIVVLPYADILTSGAAVLAMSFSKPVIAPREGALVDILDGETGFSYAKGTEMGLQTALEAAARRHVELKSMGVKARERASRWGWDRVAKQTLEIYDRVIDA